MNGWTTAHLDQLHDDTRHELVAFVQSANGQALRVHPLFAPLGEGETSTSSRAASCTIVGDNGQPLIVSDALLNRLNGCARVAGSVTRGPEDPTLPPHVVFAVASSEPPPVESAAPEAEVPRARRSRAVEASE